MTAVARVVRRREGKVQALLVGAAGAPSEDPMREQPAPRKRQRKKRVQQVQVTPDIVSAQARVDREREQARAEVAAETQVRIERALRKAAIKSLPPPSCKRLVRQIERQQKNLLRKRCRAALKRALRGLPQYRGWRATALERSPTCAECGAPSEHVQHVAWHLLDELNIGSVRHALSCTRLWDPAHARARCARCHDEAA